MTILPIGADSTALFFTCSDLIQQGLHVESLTEENTINLTREALLKTAFSFSGELNLEAYANSCGLLVFAYVSDRAQFVWNFSDFETLLSAVHCVNSGRAEGALYSWKEQLWLVLDESLPHLSEFGAEMTDEMYILPLLQEHGVLLLPENALSALHTHFS